MSENGKPGRPEFKPTSALKRRVSIAAGAGMSHEEIALGLGIARNTLEKHFEHELSVGAYERRLEVVDAMHKAALKGNVAAQKAYVALDPRPSAPPPPPPPAEQPDAPVLGKKEQAQADAKTAGVGTEWGDLLQTRMQ